MAEENAVETAEPANTTLAPPGQGADKTPVQIPIPATEQKQPAPAVENAASASEPAATTQPVPVATPVQAAAETPDPTPTTNKQGVHRETWLLQQPKSAYTLQLLGSRSEKSLRRTIAQHKLPVDKTAYYRGRYKQQDWYVLVYGIYPDRATASRHIADLPAEIRKAGPWPRPVDAIQKAIQAVQGTSP